MMRGKGFRVLSIILALTAALFLSSCASQTSALKQGYDFNKIKRIAVLQFRDPTYTQSTGAMVSQFFAKYLLKAGYNVVERDELDAILRERNLTMNNIIDPSQAKVFRLSGIDAILTGTVTKAVSEQNMYESGNLRFIAAQVGLTCKMIEVETGEILWAGSDAYDGMNEQTAFDYLSGSMVRQMARDIKDTAAK